MGSTLSAGLRVAGSGAAALALAAALASSAHAGAGLEAAFGDQGRSVLPLSGGFSDRFFSTTAGPNGGTYNVGYTSVSATDRAFVLTKTDHHGRLVPGFGTGGIATVNVSTGPFLPGPNAPSGAAQAGLTGAAEVARGVVVQADGKIVISGQAETPQDIGKPDARDLDIYVARFTTNGTLDPTFGTGGVTRIDLSNGVQAVTDPAATTSAVRADQSYGLSVRPDGRLLVTGVKGVDSSDNTTRADQDLTVVQLTADGIPDASFGTDGVASARTPGMNENPRQGAVLADGKFVTTGYGSASGPTRPWLYRFNPDGTLDASFGTGGIATGPVGGTAGRAEVYGAVLQGNDYVLAGYGARNETPTDTDLVLYKFSAAGVWDQSFGRDGLVTYAGRPGGADRARNLTLLPDGRIAAVGGTEVSLAPNSNVDGLIFVVKPDGTPDASVGTNGAISVDLGGPNDFFYGVAAIGQRVVAAGYEGAAVTADDDAVLASVDTTPLPVVATPAPTPVPTPAPAPGPVPAAAPLARTAGKVTVTCKRSGAKKDRIKCTVSQANAAAGTVKITLEKKGAKKLTGKAKAGSRSGRSTVTIKATRAKAKYTARITLPTPDGKTQTIKKTVTVS